MTDPLPDENRADPLPTETVSHPGTIARPRLPERIGRYHVKCVIASGGMGTVYEATQDNPRRVVALKVMKQGIASKSALRRFEYEGQVLGRLRHPGIAQIYEAGTHHDPAAPGAAVPFFAMEYIPNAKTITRYADEKTLTVRQRMELFAKVCDAVHHGHQKGIIHRDLKPGNILVDAHGEVKVIDFGVARGTDSDLAVTMLQTDIGQLVGTLQYMSPEQCEGDPHDIDTRSDVYALGVVLYELLSGKLPYDVSRSKIFDGTRMIREQQPTKLGTIDTALRGDVETIVFKALEKGRDRRYQSAVEFAQDIRRYLSGEAITARPPSIIYQLRVFARRNKAVFASLAAVFIVLLAGIIVSTSLYLRAESARQRAILAEQDQSRERERAEQEAQISQEVTEFLVKLFEVSDPSESRGNSITAREILDKGAEKIIKELKARPLVQATLMDTMGRVYDSLGLCDAATPLLETALRMRRDNLGPEHPTVAETLHNLGVLQFHKGSWIAGEQAIREALAMRRKLLGNEHCDLAESLHVVARLAWNRGDFDEMERLAREELAIRRKSLPEDTPPDRNVAMAMNSLARALAAKGSFDEAEHLLREALAALRAAVGDDHPDVVESLSNLGNILYEKGDLDGAERAFREALVIDRRVYGNEHLSVVMELSTLSTIAMHKGDDAAAELLLREALTIERKVVPDGDLVTAANLCDLALVLVKRNQPAESEAPARECLAMARRKAGEGSYRIPEAESILGACLTALQRYEEAEPLLLESNSGLADKAQEEHAGPKARRMQKCASEALQRIIELYESWDSAEPGKGHSAKAGQWRAKLEESQESRNVETRNHDSEHKDSE